MILTTLLVSDDLFLELTTGHMFITQLCRENDQTFPGGSPT